MADPGTAAQGVTVISLQAGEGREPGCQLLSADPHYFPFFLFEIKVTKGAGKNVASGGQIK